jgi:hypothetical protein
MVGDFVVRLRSKNFTGILVTPFEKMPWGFTVRLVFYSDQDTNLNLKTRAFLNWKTVVAYLLASSKAGHVKPFGI